MKPVNSDAEPLRPIGHNDLGKWVPCTDGTWVMVTGEALFRPETWRPQHYDRPSIWQRVKGYFGGGK